MTIATILVHGNGGNAYDTDAWTVSVEYDGEDIYTVDSYGDIDVIGNAETDREAQNFIREYFSHAYYQEV